MPEYRTYYEILDIGFDADDATIRRAYRKAAAAHHPDRVDLSNRAQKRIRELNIARETLLNSELRQKYNYQLFKMGIISDDFVEENGNKLDDLFDNTNFTAGSTEPGFSWGHHNQQTGREKGAYDPSGETSSQGNSSNYEEWGDLTGPVLYSSANYQAWKPKKSKNWYIITDPKKLTFKPILASLVSHYFYKNILIIHETRGNPLN